jgi:hypothetical protein
VSKSIEREGRRVIEGKERRPRGERARHSEFFHLAPVGFS